MTAGLSGLPEDEATLFNALPTDGSSVSDPSLRQFLRWTQDRYFAARDGLVDRDWCCAVLAGAAWSAGRMPRT